MDDTSRPDQVFKITSTQGIDHNNKPTAPSEVVNEKSHAALSSAHLHSTLPAPLPDTTAKPGSRKSLLLQQHQQQKSTTESTNAAPDSKPQRAGGIFAYAAAALDRTLSESRNIRSRPSLNRLSVSVLPESTTTTSSPRQPTGGNNGSSSPEKKARNRASVSNLRLSSLGTPPSQPYNDTDPSQPAPVHVQRLSNKMHQTSSRLLRMTDDDRPFTKDFKDLFATLIVSMLPLTPHRVRLTKIDHTFLSEDAINNLGSLKFSQSNRMPDPKDVARIVTTTTTTTFSMAKEMARSMLQRFLEARLIESADGKYQQVYTMRGTVWQLTPKGISILDSFASRNGIQDRQIPEIVGSSLAQLVTLERDPATDKLVKDFHTIEVIFGRFIGIHGPNVKSSVSSADSDSLSDYRDGLTGVKMAPERKVNGKIHKDTFTGKAASEWLMDCCTTVDRREAVEIASLFVEYELIEALQQDRSHIQQFPGCQVFQPTKHAIYHMTSKGKDMINGSVPRGRASEGDATHSATHRHGVARDSNTQRMDKILNDAALRLLFRENLRETHCEENLSFYLDVEEFVRLCRSAVRQAQLAQSSPANSAEAKKQALDGVKEVMAQAYGIYNAFLAPGSPCELNIDHQLRNNLATRMTKAVGQDSAMVETLQEVMALFEDAQNAVFKLMASDSVPKFLRSRRYEHLLKNYDFDSVSLESSPRVPERSQSRSQRL
ncbi:hypothetical protein ACKVWC_004500 [Pyricularia oryzae]|nr:developmental regulator flbA [Pyricularia oryzae]KAI7932713.1 developmental regulator flbA [Pyricularia oryzae]